MTEIVSASEVCIRRDMDQIRETQERDQRDSMNMETDLYPRVEALEALHPELER
ncbi:MAG: hypothetical protein ACYCW6_00965 [Candidatus Xenobia bacterium]